MDKELQQAVQVTKEIVVKFIEVGRVSPTNFSEIFPALFREVHGAIKEASVDPTAEDAAQTTDES